MKNKFAKILLVAFAIASMLLLACACGDDACTHENQTTLEAVAATCTESGLTEGKQCAYCQEIIVAQEVVNALGHTDEVVPGLAATCTEAGLTDGAKCSVCGVTTLEQETIDALGHTEKTLDAVAPDCVNTGLTEGKKCSVCDEILVAQETVDALGHTEKTLDAVAPNCTETGLTEGKQCTVCEVITVAQETVNALGHKDEVVAGYAATCTETGLKNGTKCSVCGVTTLEREVIPALGHKDEIVEGYDATCTETGLKDGTKCSVCGVTTLEREIIPAFGHGNVSVYDENTDTIACEVCGDKFINVTTEIYTEEKPLCSADCTGENCDVHNLTVTVTGIKQPAAPDAIEAGVAYTSSLAKNASYIYVVADEEAAYTVKLIGENGDVIATLESIGTAYVNVCDYAKDIASVEITASAAATVSFYTAI